MYLGKKLSTYQAVDEPTLLAVGTPADYENRAVQAKAGLAATGRTLAGALKWAAKHPLVVTRTKTVTKTVIREVEVPVVVEKEVLVPVVDSSSIFFGDYLPEELLASAEAEAAASK